VPVPYGPCQVQPEEQARRPRPARFVPGLRSHSARRFRCRFERRRAATRRRESEACFELVVKGIEVSADRPRRFLRRSSLRRPVPSHRPHEAQDLVGTTRDPRCRFITRAVSRHLVKDVREVLRVLDDRAQFGGVVRTRARHGHLHGFACPVGPHSRRLRALTSEQAGS
jgi:hypothetical protein